MNKEEVDVCGLYAFQIVHGHKTQGVVLHPGYDDCDDCCTYQEYRETGDKRLSVNLVVDYSVGLDRDITSYSLIIMEYITKEYFDFQVSRSM